jgi:colanic acid biosynthesis glycosyl transferase WcaI
MSRRILLITQWFDPEPAFKGLLFARELVARGFDVEVLTGFPNYPGGKIYPGYRVRALQRECVDGVRISRVALFPSHDRSAWKRVLNYVSFAFSASIYGVFFSRRFDVIYAYHPPLTVGIAAALIRFFRRRPLVYDIQDLWPDTLAATGMLSNRRVLKWVDVFCRWVYSQSDHLAVLSPGFKSRLVSRGVPAEKVSVIYNWADESSLRPVSSVELRLRRPTDDNPLIVLFAGNMGRAQGLESVLEAARLLEGQGCPVQFHFIGGGLEAGRLKSLADEWGLRSARFFDPVPMTKIGRVIASADVLLVHLRPGPLFEITIPSKTQAYLCAGKPILMAVEGDAANLVNQAGAGILASPGDAQSIARAVWRFLSLKPEQIDEMGRRGAEFYNKQLSVKSGVDDFSRLFELVMRGMPVVPRSSSHL